MCSIFAGTTKEEFEYLYNINKKRGLRSFSVCEYNTEMKTFHLHKNTNSEVFSKLNCGSDFFIGHCQDPTSGSDDGIDSFHPFCVGEWHVFHNGVITNVKELANEYNNGVVPQIDSHIIAIMLDGFSKRNKASDLCFKRVLSLLEGTCGIIAYNIKEMRTYAARQGVTLFYSNTAISSVATPTVSELITPGAIVEFASKLKHTIHGAFKVNSPFLSI